MITCWELSVLRVDLQKFVRNKIVFAQLKARCIEFVKYDYNQYKLILVLFARFASYVLYKLGKIDKSFSIASNVYRTGWAGSYEFGLHYAKLFFSVQKNEGKKLIDMFVRDIEALENTKKFFDDPSKMFPSVVTVLQNPEGNQKGALIINYSYYFPLFVRFFDVEAISKRFHIILEPSWAGFCELNILEYTQFNFPVFLQVYEARDMRFIKELNSNLIPIDVGPSWFIDHDRFDGKGNLDDRGIDLIMVAAWASFKRHHAFFKAIKPYIKKYPETKVVLVGYPVDLTKKDIERFAKEEGILNNVTIYEWIKPQEVAELQSRAKLNILWSKFEGNNRAIIEGMFANTPVIMRKGHNYGEHYDFINDQTGMFSNEKSLANDVESIVQGGNSFSPRKYVLEHRNSELATRKMGRVISSYETSNNGRWEDRLAVKINDLHGMSYKGACQETYSDAYLWLKTQRLSAGSDKSA